MLPAIIGIGAGVSALSGLVGYLRENGKEEEAQRIMELAGREYNNISLPVLTEIANEVLGPSAFEQIKVSPEFKAAQIKALDDMSQIEESGGLALEDRANLNRVRNQVAQSNSARDASIIDNMQARGIAGSGAELATRLASNQAAANQENQAGLDIAAAARKRRFDAIRERAGMAGSMRSQDFDEQSRVAQAKDARDAFNFGARRDATRYNNSLRQQQFGNSTALADRKYGVAQDRAGALRRQGQRQGQVIAGVGGALGRGMSVYGSQAGGTQYAGLDPNTEVSAPTMLSEEDEYYGK